MAKKEAKPKPVRFTNLTGTVGEFLGAFSEVEDLGNEFREICDNTSENLQQTDLYSRRDETASACEGLSEVSVNSSILEELECSTQIDNGKTYRGRQSQSRACRASNAAGQIRAAGEAMREWLEAHGEVSVDEDSDQPGKYTYTINGEGSDISYATEDEAKEALAEELGYDVDEYDTAREEAESAADECDSLADEIEGLEWPGMFG